VEVDVQIERVAETLDEGDRTALGATSVPLLPGAPAQ
jgi:hypothetical protein